MKKAEATVKIVTPCIMAGTDQHTAELRPASIRGQLRWWFRLLYPNQADREKAIFGGVHNGARASSVVVRVKTRKDQIRITDKQKAEDIADSNYDYFLWPLGRNNSTPRGIIEPGQTFEMSIVHRYLQTGEALPQDVLQAFLLFGALGTRSRRCYGSIYPDSLVVDGESWDIPQNLEQFGHVARQLLKPARCTVLQVASPEEKASDAVGCCAECLRTFRCGSDRNGMTPSKWGKHDHNAPFSQDETVYRQAIGLPLEQRYTGSSHARFCSEIPNGERWASPLLLKVVPLAEGYVPLAIFCNSMVMPEQRITLRDGGREHQKKLSHDLWNAMQNPQRHTEVGWNGAKILA